MMINFEDGFFAAFVILLIVSFILGIGIILGESIEDITKLKDGECVVYQNEMYCKE